MTLTTSRLSRRLRLPQPVRSGRVTAQRDHEVVVFTLGVRLHKPWKLKAWILASIGFIKMTRWLEEHPEQGMLGNSLTFLHGGVAAVQYWDSYDALERFARNRDAPHLPVWSWYRRAVERPGDIGIWHETYVLSPGSWECIYVNMPTVGLPAATAAVLVGEQANDSRSRRGKTTSP